MASHDAAVAVYSRSPLVDTLRALASQLIILHHLAFYGPMADSARALVGPVIDGLAEYGRLAVPVFLAVSGYLAAQSLTPAGAPGLGHPLPAIARRWLRLTPAYWAALTLATAASALARQWTDIDAIPGPPTLSQVLAHLLLLQDILGFEALSAGIWYIAIDLQLYALLTLTVWLGAQTGSRWVVPILVSALTIGSLVVFNRYPEGDVWAPYFFGSYGLGVWAAWSSANVHRVARAAVIAGVGAIALWIEYRSRIAVASLTAVALALFGHRPTLGRWSQSAAIRFLSRISYSAFLTHFSVVVLCNAALTVLFPTSPEAALTGLLLAWAGSLVVGNALYQWIEAPRPRILQVIAKLRALLRLNTAAALSSASGQETLSVSSAMATPPTRSL